MNKTYNLLLTKLRPHRLSVLVFSVSTSYILFLIHFFRYLTVDGTRFQSWDSDLMMQTLPIQALHDTPFFSLWYDHIEPPFFDSLRALLANFFYPGFNGAQLLNHVDWALYHVFAFVFGGLTLLLFTWAKRFLGERCALIFAFFWILHPAPLVYATFLDSTLIGTFIVTWLLYEFYRVDLADGSLKRLAFVTVFAFYSRSFFQWYFIPVFTLALMIRGLSRKQIILFACITSLGIAPFLIKQKVLFGTMGTCTFNGRHFTGMLSYAPPDDLVKKEREKLNYQYPENADKYSGGDPYNKKSTAEDNIIYSRLAFKKYVEDPVWVLKQFWKSYKFNRGKYWLPSSQYIKGHPIRDVLPWSKVYDAIFANTFFSQLTQECLILLFVMLFIWRRKIKFLRTALSYFPPVGVIFASCMFGNQFNWTEVDRLKFLLEPSIYLFICWIIATLIRTRLRSNGLDQTEGQFQATLT